MFTGSDPFFRGELDWRGWFLNLVEAILETLLEFLGHFLFLKCLMGLSEEVL